MEEFWLCLVNIRILVDNKVIFITVTYFGIIYLVCGILEKVVLLRLQVHRSENHLVERCQLAYRKGYSTETALFRVQNDILKAVDDGKCVFLVLLDLWAAFDTVSHHMLLRRLELQFFIKGNALDWLVSYLRGRC